MKIIITVPDGTNDSVHNPIQLSVTRKRLLELITDEQNRRALRSEDVQREIEYHKKYRKQLEMLIEGATEVSTTMCRRWTAEKLEDAIDGLRYDLDWAEEDEDGD